MYSDPGSTQMEFSNQVAIWQSELTKELASGHVKFPDVLDIPFNIKKITSDPESSMAQISQVVQSNEAFSNKVMKMSRMLAFNSSFSSVRTVKDAVNRIGILAIRCLAFAVAAEELVENEQNSALHELASEHWKHTVEVATSAFALGQDMHSGEPGTDLLSGLLMNVAEFFLLDRISSYPAFALSLPRFAHAVISLRRQVRQKILIAFDIPEHIVRALPIEDRTPPVNWPPKTLEETLMVARFCATTPNPFDVLAGRPPVTTRMVFGDSAHRKVNVDLLLSNIQEERLPMIAALRN